MGREPRALTFSIKNGKNGKNKTIRFEILGENKQIEAFLEEDEDSPSKDGEQED